MTAATYTDRVRLLAAAAPHLSDAEYKLVDRLNRLTGSCGCRPGSERLQNDLGWTQAKLEYVISGLTGAPSARARRRKLVDRPSLMDCPRTRYVDRLRKRVTWRRSFKIRWEIIAGLVCKTEGQGGGLVCKSAGVSSSGFESALQILQPETHTARAQDPEPVCVFSESKAEKAESTPQPEPEKPKPQPARQESDTDRRQASGPPDDRHPATVLLQAFVALPWAAHSQNAVKRRWWRLFEAGADLELIYECARLTPAPKLIPPVWLDDERWLESPHFAKVERALAQRQRDAELQAAEDSMTDAQREASEQRRRGLDQQAQEDHQREREESRERSDAGRLAFFASLPRSIARHRSSAAAG